MRWWLVASLLVVSIAAAATTCKGTSKVDVIKKDYSDEVGWYKKLTSLMMRGMIGEISPTTTTSIGLMAQEPENAVGYSWEIMKDHPWVLALFFVMLVIAFLLFVAMIVVLIFRWFCSKNAMGVTPTLSQIICTLVAFTICCAICACGAFVYFVSLKSVNEGIGDVGEMLGKTTSQVTIFADEYFTSMECNGKLNQGELTKFVKNVEDDIENRLNEFVDLLKHGIAVGNRVVTKFGTLVPNLVTQIRDLQDDEKKVEDEMRVEANKMKNKVKEAETEINKVYKQLLDAIKTAKTSFQGIEKNLLSAAEKSDKYATIITTSVQYTFIIPLILCAIMAFGFVVILLRFLANRAQKIPEKRGKLSVVAGNILGVTGYVAMCTGSLLFLIAAATFLIAFISMFFCIGFFDDPDLLILKAIPYLTRTLGNSDITLHNAFVRCRNEFPFFDAIDGGKQLASKNMEKITDEIAATDFGKRFRVLEVKGPLLQSIEFLMGHPASQADPDVQEFHGLMYQLNSRADRDEMLLGIEDQLWKTLDDLATLIGKQMETSLDLSPHCDAMNTIWNNVGGFICNGVSMPAQGAWVACVICGIASFTVFHWMFKSTRYLKNHDNNKAFAKKEKKDKKDKKGKKQKGAANLGESAVQNPGQSAMTDPGQSATTNPGDSNVTNIGQYAVTNPGESGMQNPGESAMKNPGESTVQNPGEPAMKNPEQSATTNSAETPKKSAETPNKSAETPQVIRL